MINILEIKADSTPASLLKEFRKKLMTGGATVKLNEHLSPEEVSGLYRLFAEGLVESAHGLSALVLAEIAKHGQLSSDIRASLVGSNEPEILDALFERDDIQPEEEKKLLKKIPLERRGYFLLTAQVKRLSKLSVSELEEFYQKHSPDKTLPADEDGELEAEVDVQARLALCRRGGLAPELRRKLERDRDPRVRFAVREYFRVANGALRN